MRRSGRHATIFDARGSSSIGCPQTVSFETISAPCSPATRQEVCPEMEHRRSHRPIGHSRFEWFSTTRETSRCGPSGWTSATGFGSRTRTMSSVEPHDPDARLSLERQPPPPPPPVPMSSRHR